MCVAFLFADDPGGLSRGIFNEVLVGLLVAAIIAALAALTRWGRWLLNRIFFGKIRVEGRWTTKLTRGGGVAAEHEKAALRQLLNRVRGETETWPKPPEGGVKYKVRGWIQGQKLILTYRQIEGPGFDSGACVLYIRDDAKKLIGYEVGPDTTTDEGTISAFRYEWTKEGPGASGPASASAGAGV